MARLAWGLTLALLSGCVAPTPMEGPAWAPESVPIPPGGAAAPPSAPISLPLRAMAASDGAEPSILATRDGALYIGDTSGLVKSTDGGATWRAVPVPFLGGFFTDGWALAEDDVGTLYAGVTNGQMLSLAASDDGGASWRVTHIVDVSIVGDRPWIAARGDGQVAFIYYDTKTAHEACLFSDDGGRTFLTRYAGVNAYPNAGNAAFGEDGALYYTTNLVGYRWDEPCVGEPARLLHGAAKGATIFTQIAVAPGGVVYVAGPSGDNGRMVLYGKAPSAPWKSVVVSAPELRSNTFAAISASADEVVVAWYASTTPGDPADPAYSGAWNVHAARVQDLFGSAPVVERIVVTTEPNHVGDFCMTGISCTEGDRDLLDYFGIDHGPEGAVHIAYGHDGAGSSSEVRYARLPPAE